VRGCHLLKIIIAIYIWAETLPLIHKVALVAAINAAILAAAYHLG